MHSCVPDSNPRTIQLMAENSFPLHFLHETQPHLNAVDLSPFLLVEATGDSEFDYDPNMPPVPHLAAVDDDDAQSCSYEDYSDHSCVTDPAPASCHRHRHRHQLGQSYSRFNDVDGNDEEGEEEAAEEEVCCYKRWNDGLNFGMPMNLKSCESVDSTSKPMNEAEKSRLFWEACLAS